jgi:hypothetical protein
MREWVTGRHPLPNGVFVDNEGQCAIGAQGDARYQTVFSWTRKGCPLPNGVFADKEGDARYQTVFSRTRKAIARLGYRAMPVSKRCFRGQ